jgi:hypothetical protein
MNHAIPPPPETHPILLFVIVMEEHPPLGIRIFPEAPERVAVKSNPVRTALPLWHLI